MIVVVTSIKGSVNGNALHALLLEQGAEFLGFKDSSPYYKATNRKTTKHLHGLCCKGKAVRIG